MSGLRCIACASTDLPLGRPRKDGSRWPMRYCRACANTPRDRRESKLRAHRTYRQRRDSGTRVILGPCPCRDCGEPGLVYLAQSAALGRWVGQDGRRHWCGGLSA